MFGGERVFFVVWTAVAIAAVFSTAKVWPRLRRARDWDALKATVMTAIAGAPSLVVIIAFDVDDISRAVSARELVIMPGLWVPLLGLWTVVGAALLVASHGTLPWWSRKGAVEAARFGHLLLWGAGSLMVLALFVFLDV